MWKGSQQMSAGEGFFRFDEADNFLLEDSSPEDYHAPLNSMAQCCLCNCGHKKNVEVSNSLKFRSYQGYLPEIEEEASMPFSFNQNRNKISPPSDEEYSYATYLQPGCRSRGRNTQHKEEESMPVPYSQRGSGISPPGDEEYSYIAYPSNSRGRVRSTLDGDLEFGFSDPSSVGRRSSVGMPYLSVNTEELVMERNISESFQRMDLEKDHMMLSQPSHFAFQTRPRDGRKMIVYGPGKLCRTAQERFDIYDGRATYLERVSDSRNPRYQVPQSAGFEVQYFHSNHGVLVPTIIPPKHRATSNSASELPLSSSVSVSSDETEHPQIKVGLYKTELCRSWEETGYCRYAAKCQFAHGNDDLRPVPRHPKYKTELCRSYTETGLCSYGKRCRFIHRQDSQASDLEKKGSRRLSIFQKLCTGAGENLPPRQP